MDAIVHGSVSLETEIESSLLSPKRPRIDYTVTNTTSTYDLPDRLTLQTLGAPSLTSPIDADLICVEQNGHIQDKKTCEQIQDTIVTVGPLSEVTISNTPEVYVTTEESPFLHLKKCDQLDKLNPSPLSGSCTLKDSTAVISSHPGCQLPEKSFEDKPAADCNLPCKNGLSNDLEVRHQSDFSCHFNRHDTVPSTWSQFVAFDESNQKEEDFTDTIFQQGLRQDEEEKSLCHIKEFQLFISPPDKDIPVRLAEDKSKVDMCDSHVVCDRETNDQANDNGTSDIASPVECTEVSLISYHANPAKYISTETESPDDFGRARGEYGATAAETEMERVHHTPENQMSARISKESAEGDNDADPHRVIDLAVWSKTVREAEGNCCNSESIAGEELPPSVIVCELEIPPPPTSDARPLQPTIQSPNQRSPQQHEDKKENLTESFSFPAFGMHNTSGYEGSCHVTSSPSISPQTTTKPPAGDGRQHSCLIGGHHLVEQSSCLPVSCDYLKAQHVKQSLPGGADVRDEPKEMAGEIKSDELVLQQNRSSNEDMSELTPVEGLTEGAKMTLGEEAIHDITHSSFPVETVEMVECKDELLASLSDAIVPGPRGSSPRGSSPRHSSQNTNRVMAHNCQDKFPPLPSAFAMYTHVPGAFDNFHKFLLSPDDDDAVQENVCPHTSLAMQLMKSPQMDHSMLEVEHVEMLKEMEVDQVLKGGGRVECYIEDFANGDINTDVNCTQGLSDEGISASEFSNDAAENKRPPTDPIQCLEFKMKKEFDSVLKELNVYFDICKSEIACDNETAPGQCGDVLSNDVSKCRSSPELALHRDTTSGPDEDHSTEVSVTDAEACCITNRKGEQEVPFGYHTSPQASTRAAENHKETQQTELKRTAWSPSFMCLPLMQPQSHAALWQAKRLEPLRTCTRPIRLGLSKRANTKSLHRFHPCKKEE